MKIKLRVAGSKLFESIQKLYGRLDFPLPRRFHDEPLEWVIENFTSDITADDFLLLPEAPSILLIEVTDIATVRRLRLLEGHIPRGLEGQSSLPPVVLVFDSVDTVGTQEFPDCVTDWMYSSLPAAELGRRITLALKRTKVVERRLTFSSLRLMPESRMLTFEDRVMQLTLSECMLIELFMRQMGAVVSFKDLIQFFNRSGKSAESNNIRVAIFQLRLKLALLTQSEIVLVNIYRHGYCLRNNGSRSLEKTPRERVNVPLSVIPGGGKAEPRKLALARR